MRLLLTEVGLLDKEDQYAKIKVIQGSKRAEQNKTDAAGQEEEVPSKSPLTSNAVACNKSHENHPLSASSAPPSSSFSISDIPVTPISLKEDNQRSITLIHNPVFHACIKHIDIQHHYIRDEVTSRRIHLQYIPTSEMIADRMTKALTYAKFHLFVKQIRMS